MDYLNKEHERRFQYLIEEDHTCASDKERQSLFYILAGNRDLYEKRRFVYDSQEHCIIPRLRQRGKGVDFSSGIKALVHLGFNLYNGRNQKDASVWDIFSSLDEENRKLAWNAIQIRFM